MARIELVNVGKTFGGLRQTFSIQNLNLTIPNGKVMVILGPSGCGKTTILRLIAGLIKPDTGEVRYNGVDMAKVPPGERRIGMVFQSYALYPHLTSRTNILSYFFFRPKTPELDALAQAKFKRTSELMGVEIKHLLDRMPPTLSGGEKQRVALARCITRDPVVFLLDEPFSNLDQNLREKLRVNLKALLNQFQLTTVYVTHDQQEALILADLLAVMSRGKIEQVGTYEQVYHRPRNLFVAEFLNLDLHTPPMNRLEGHRVAPAFDGRIVGVRPADIVVSREPREDGVRGTLADKRLLTVKDLAILTIRVEGELIHAYASARALWSVGDEVWLSFTRYHVFDAKTGERLQTWPAE